MSNILLCSPLATVQGAVAAAAALRAAGAEPLSIEAAHFAQAEPRDADVACPSSVRQAGVAAQQRWHEQVLDRRRRGFVPSSTRNAGNERTGIQADFARKDQRCCISYYHDHYYNHLY